MQRSKQVPVTWFSPLCTLLCLQVQLFFPSVCPADQQQLMTRHPTANSQRQPHEPDHSPAQTFTVPSVDPFSRYPSSSDLSTRPMLQKDCLVTSLLHHLSSPLLPLLLLLQLQFLIPAGFLVAIEKISLKFIQSYKHLIVKTALEKKKVGGCQDLL